VSGAERADSEKNGVLNTELETEIDDY